MQHLGHIKLIPEAQIKNFKPENLATDPAVGALTESVAWYNTTEKVYKFFNGTEVLQFAVGGDLENFLKRDGTLAMTGELTLSSADQSASADTVAISKGHLDVELAKKEDVLTGAATSIAHDDLAASLALASDANGKVVAAQASVAELDYLQGTTSNVQEQIDSKQDDLGYVPLDVAGSQGGMTVDLAMNNNTVIGLKAAVDPTSPVRLAEFDSALAGLNWQDDVVAVQVDDTLDPGAAPTEGDRYVITNAAALHANFGTIADLADNDIVEYVETEFVVALDVSADTKAEGALAFNSDEGEYVRFSGTEWKTFYGLDSMTAGTGLGKDGNTFNVNFGAGVKETPEDEVGIDYAADGGIFTHVAGVESNDAAAVLGIKLDAETLKTTAAGLAVKEGGITEVQVNATTLGNGIQGGDGVKLSVTQGTGIVVDENGVSFDETYGDARYVNLTGDVLTGMLKGIDGDTDNSFMTKLYIDTADQANADAVQALSDNVTASKVVYDGTDAASMLHTITHNLNDQFVQVSVYDENNLQVIAGEVECVDANTVTVSFEAAYKCRVVVTGVKTPVAPE